jgi:hypothetical protein
MLIKNQYFLIYCNNVLLKGCVIYIYTWKKNRIEDANIALIRQQCRKITINTEKDRKFGTHKSETETLI